MRPAFLVSHSPVHPFDLCSRLTDPARLNDPGYIVEPKLDGQRAQLHVDAGRTVA
jgi:ATP-dependent DNA ligase